MKNYQERISQIQVKLNVFIKTLDVFFIFSIFKAKMREIFYD